MRWLALNPSVGRVVAGLCALWLAGGIGPSAARADAPGPASAADRLAAVLSPEARLELAFLQHLGWRLVWDEGVGEITVLGGVPCYRRSLESAHAGGDLRILVPPGVDDAALRTFGGRLAAIADAPPSRCAFKQKIHVAARRAARKLTAITERGGYGFPRILFVNDPFFRLRPPQPPWKASENGRVFHPATSSAEAIEVIYERGGLAECYAGQLTAIWATQYELYGAEWFDEVFATEEVALGRPDDFHATALGQYARMDVEHRWRALLIVGEDQEKDPGLVLANYGPKAFSGLTGIVMDQNLEDSGANQNFMIVSVSPRAVEQMRANDGFAYLTELSRRAHAQMERAGGMFTSRCVREACERKIDEIFTSPVFTEIWVYVHPFGILTMGELFRREMEQDGVPVFIIFYAHGLEEALYQKFRAAFKAKWARENGVPAPAPAGAG
ncbi:MAG: hypothetical protein ACYTG6_09700 [Planctomycetota bacterium]|jgi:hypothetical protein